MSSAGTQKLSFASNRIVRRELADDPPQIGIAVVLIRNGIDSGIVFRMKGSADRRERGEEHRLPTVSLDQLLADQGGQDAADGVAANIRVTKRRASFRRELGHLRDDVRHDTANTQAGEEA